MTISEGSGVLLVTYCFMIPLILIVILKDKMKLTWFLMGNCVILSSTMSAFCITKSLHIFVEAPHIQDFIIVNTNVIMQEISRFVVYMMIKYADQFFMHMLHDPLRSARNLKDSTMSDMRSSSITSYDRPFLTLINFGSASFFSGIGIAFGLLYQQFFYFNIIIFGPGTTYYSDYIKVERQFILIQSIMALLRCICQICWTVIFFNAMQMNFAFGPIFILVIHVNIALMSSYVGTDVGAGKIVLIIQTFVTVCCVMWAYQCLGGQLDRFICCQKQAENRDADCDSGIIRAISTNDQSVIKSMVSTECTSSAQLSMESRDKRLMKTFEYSSGIS